MGQKLHILQQGQDKLNGVLQRQSQEPAATSVKGFSFVTSPWEILSLFIQQPPPPTTFFPDCFLFFCRVPY